MNEQEAELGRLYWLLAHLLEQVDWERRCAEEGWEPQPLSWRHQDIEAKARDEIARTVKWWEHAHPEQAHRLIGSTEPIVIKQRWGRQPDRLAAQEPPTSAEGLEAHPDADPRRTFRQAPEGP